MWTAANNVNIEVNNIRLIFWKLNELKLNVFVEERTVDFHSAEINRKVFK